MQHTYQLRRYTWLWEGKVLFIIIATLSEILQIEELDDEKFFNIFEITK